MGISPTSVPRSMPSVASALINEIWQLNAYSKRAPPQGEEKVRRGSLGNVRDFLMTDPFEDAKGNELFGIKGGARLIKSPMHLLS